MKIHVIINPAAGKETPVLGALNQVFAAAEIPWQVSVTNGPGDAARMAREAAEAGATIVAAYGGDGSVMEVASGLIGTEARLAILPGGTANVMSVELGIPADLVEAASLLVDPESRTVEVDMGEMGDGGHFILRIGIGLEAEMVEGADRELKDRIGPLAYGVAALQALVDSTPSTYRITVDGESREVEGISCLICNSGSVGQGDLTLSPTISVSDGQLDVVVLRKKEISSLLSIVKDVVTGEVPAFDEVLLFSGREIEVESTPAQEVQADGEVLGTTPVRARVVPAAVRVIVPAERAAEDSAAGQLRPQESG